MVPQGTSGRTEPQLSASVISSPSSPQPLYPPSLASWGPLPKDRPHQGPGPGSVFKTLSSKAGGITSPHPSHAQINNLVSFFGVRGG